SKRQPLCSSNRTSPPGGSSTSLYQSKPAASPLPANSLIELVLDGSQGQAPALQQPRRGLQDTITTGSTHLGGPSTSLHRSRPAASPLPATSLLGLVLDGSQGQDPALQQPRRRLQDSSTTGSTHLGGSSTSLYQSKPAASPLPANSLIELVLDGSQGQA